MDWHEELLPWVEEDRPVSLDRDLWYFVRKVQVELSAIAREGMPAAFRAKADPDDFVQEAYLRAADKFSQFQGRTNGELRAWLKTILHHILDNVHARQLTKTQRNLREVPFVAGQTEEPRDFETASWRMMIDEVGDALRQTIAELPEQTRLILRLRAEDYPFVEIAEITNLSRSSATRIYFNALKDLKRRLKAHSEEALAPDEQQRQPA